MDAPSNNHKFPHYQPYPFSIGYASSILKKEGENVIVFDACALDMNEKQFIEKVNYYNPNKLIIEVPIISSTLVLKMLQSVNDNIEIILTGSITALGIDKINSKYNTNYKMIEGQWDTKLSNRHKKFKDFPFPDRNRLPNQNYSNFETVRPTAQIITSRGCPHNCTFCLERYVTYNSSIIEFRTPENIVDEIELLIEMYNVKHIYFDDMSITSKKSHIEGICNELLSRNIEIEWTCMGDILVDENTLKLMSISGCKGLAFGVETLNESTLNDITKNFVNEEKVKNFINTLKRYNIWSHATYTIGLPDETKESVMKTIEFATTVGSDSLQFSIATPYPGTPFYETCKNNGWLITDEFSRYDGSHYSVIDYPNLSHTEIESLFKFAMNRREKLGLKFRKS